MTLSACSADAGVGNGTGRNSGPTALCQQITDDILAAAPKNAIESLSNPDLVGPDSPFIEFLLPTDRVIGIEVDGEYLAVPHNVLWWHEIANFDDLGLAVTYCPITGSSMVFHRSNANAAFFGVSGLLWKNNLVMFDRNLGREDETLWPQMLAGGVCGPLEGSELPLHPAIEIEWEDWLALHPDTRVVSSRTGFGQNYQQYPYGRHETLDNALAIDIIEDPDLRRLPKERILGIQSGSSGRGFAFPFGALRDAAVGGLTVVHSGLGEESGPDNVEPIVVFWDSSAEAAAAFQPATGSRDLTFEVRNGAFMDVETGSRWSIEGKAISGPLEGERLLAKPTAYVSFWFAFSQIFPNPVLWLP